MSRRTSLRDYLLEGLEQRISLSGEGLDPSFGNGGVVRLPLPDSSSGGADAIAFQPDGKILVAAVSLPANDSGAHVLKLFRYTSNGVLDTTFGTQGAVSLPKFGIIRSFGDSRINQIRSISVLNSGKLLLTDAYEYSESNWRLAQVQLTSTGALDTTFGTGGIIANVGPDPGKGEHESAVRPNGQTVEVTAVIGDPDFTVTQRNADGSLDTSFGQNGSVVVALPEPIEIIGRVAIAGDGDILIGPSTYETVDQVYLVRISAPGVSVVRTGSTLRVTGTSGGDVIGVDRVAGAYRVGARGQGIIASVNANLVTRISIDAGAGKDKVTLDPAVTIASIVAGGTGNDVLLGGSGNDSLAGGNGNDKLVGRLGADTLDGGAGIDLVEYTDRSALEPISANLDGLANDGARNERDQILTSVENLLGGNGNDVLVGDNNANVLAGSRGADRLLGGGGNDRLFAFLESRANDALADTLDGGAGSDTAVSDALDILLSVP